CRKPAHLDFHMGARHAPVERRGLHGLGHLRTVAERLDGHARQWRNDLTILGDRFYRDIAGFTHCPIPLAEVSVPESALAVASPALYAPITPTRRVALIFASARGRMMS